MSEQIRITKRKQKRREPTTEELQADFLEQREQEAIERIRRKLGKAAQVVDKIGEVIEPGV